MVEQKHEEFGSLVDALTASGVAPDANARAKVADTMAKVFDVDPDEVAILRLNPKSKNLMFVIPEKLALVGSIPLSSATSLAARTARERRPELVNNFSSSRHPTVFEGIPLGRQRGELIQKIMSAPILDGTQVRGVVQISRKGRTASESGEDFTQKELRLLVTLSPALERFLKLCPDG